MQLEDLVRHETAHSGLAFCELAPGTSVRNELVQQILGLANAEVDGTRYLVLGVRDRLGGRREIVGITKERLAEAKEFLRKLVTSAVEPKLKLAMKVIHIEAVMVGLVSIESCVERPYMLKANLSDSLHAGRGWIRRGAKLQPLARADLLNMLTARDEGQEPLVVRIGFPGKVIQAELSLDALPLDELPSELAAARVRKMLEARQDSRDLFGRTDTRIDRLLHAQQFGSQLAYESHSDQSLRTQLDSIVDQYGPADDHYKFELRAHQVQVVIYNDSDTVLEDAVVSLKIPRLEGIGVADKLYALGEHSPSDYPVIETVKRSIRLRSEVGEVPPRVTVPAFLEPPRLWARENAVDVTLPVSCTLKAKQLPEGQSTMLRIRITPPPTTG